MNHLPYREWLLSEANLSAEQASDLQDHLRDCEACRQLEAAWGDVHVLMKKAPVVEPSADFIERWHKRLEQHRLHKQRRMAWYIVAVVAAVAAILIAIFGAQLQNILSSPGNLILLWVSRLTEVLSIYWAFENIFSGVAAQVPSFSWLLLVFGIGLASFLSVAWLATYRKLTLVRRLA